MNKLIALLAASLVSSFIVDQPNVKWPTYDTTPVKFFGHRGIKAQQPEHTVGSYWLAAINGDDYIEPDLVLTKDGVPVCYHDLYIRDGTDVEQHPEFAHLRRNYTGMLDGHNTTISNEFFISDFTLAELRKLRVVQKKTGVRPQFYNQLFRIPTFQEFIDNANLLAYKLGYPINIVPELKHSNYHANLYPNIPHYFENKALDILKQNGYPLKASDPSNCIAKIETKVPKVPGKCAEKEQKPVKCGKVAIQSFDFETIKYLNTKVDKKLVDLVMLVDDDVELYTYKKLDEISQHATWFSPWKEFIYVGVENELKGRNVTYDQVKVEKLGGIVPGKQIISECHKRGLRVVLYTFYDSRETSYRGCSVKCEPENARDEYRFYFDLGVDGLFVENANEAIQMRTEYSTELRLNVTRH
ncbi:PLC-like phosphodiesterase [Neoconidiobolus thromboides FSU 785]|nr:PLC-like phosphodiesterase [Neoconidiobolus thromboides FSU 785]